MQPQCHSLKELVTGTDRYSSIVTLPHLQMGPKRACVMMSSYQ